MSQSRIANERRQYPRLERNIPVKICTENSDIVTETKNLSRTGTYCRVKKYIEPMTKLKIVLLLPLKRIGKSVTKKIACQGVIVRTESEAGNEFFNIAIYFNDIKDRDADCISEYITASLQNGLSGKN